MGVEDELLVAPERQNQSQPGQRQIGLPTEITRRKIFPVASKQKYARFPAFSS
jgi:hypothetical protein